MFKIKPHMNHHRQLYGVSYKVRGIEKDGFTVRFNDLLSEPPCIVTIEAQTSSEKSVMGNNHKIHARSVPATSYTSSLITETGIHKDVVCLKPVVDAVTEPVSVDEAVARFDKLQANDSTITQMSHAAKIISNAIDIEMLPAKNI